ncbi:MAG TPA: hypothetical protein VFD00_00160 [Thermoclostridium sp.]|nr:hypothetical protein [Thermoclostridium sp.]
MLKKIMFILLVSSLMILGSLVCMAYGDDDINEGSYMATRLNDFVDFAPSAVNVENDAPQEEEYSDEAVIEQYSSLFFETEDETEVEFITDIQDCVDKESQKCTFYATISENIQIDEGDNIVVMAFVQKDDSYELLASGEFEITIKYLRPIELNLPNTGKDNPNYVRIIVFPKNSYDNLSLDNVQIYCKTKVIDNKKFDFESTLFNGPMDIIKHVNGKISD